MQNRDDDNYAELLAYLKKNGYESFLGYFTKNRPEPDYYQNIYLLFPDNHLSWDLTDELGRKFCPQYRVHGYLIDYLVNTICTHGHTLADRKTLFRNFRDHAQKRYLSVNDSQFQTALSDLSQRQTIRIIGDNVWHKNMFHYEKTITETLREVAEMEPVELSDPAEFRGDLTDVQFEILKSVGKNRITIMDGLPGTGKTFCSKQIVEFLEENDIPVWLLAPTGLAAKNLADRCERPARTLHSFVMLKELGLNGNVAFLVDEFSMVDVRIFSQFLSTVFMDCDPIFIFVGDTGQLPSVGPGQIFKELIELRDHYKISYHRLTQIMRQASGSEIIVNAHKIRFGQTDLVNKNQFMFVEQDEASVTELLIKAATKLKEQGKESGKDFVVLSPTHKNQCGVSVLNERLRELFNPPSLDKYETARGHWRVGDKVLVNQNFYQIGLVNGDIGTIKAIFDERTFLLQLLDREVKVGKEVVRSLKHAYALTIHKAQGQEFPIVLMPFVNSFHVQLQRKLLYTAVTRAKQKVIIFGHRAALTTAIKKDREEFRKTGLKILVEAL